MPYHRMTHDSKTFDRKTLEIMTHGVRPTIERQKGSKAARQHSSKAVRQGPYSTVPLGTHIDPCTHTYMHIPQNAAENGDARGELQIHQTWSAIAKAIAHQRPHTHHTESVLEAAQAPGVLRPHREGRAQ